MQSSRCKSSSSRSPWTLRPSLPVLKAFDHKEESAFMEDGTVLV